jgi:hypothetical protein
MGCDMQSGRSIHFQVLLPPLSGSPEALVLFCQTTLYHNAEGRSINNFVRLTKRLIECRREVNTLCNLVQKYLLGSDSDFMNIQGPAEVKLSLLVVKAYGRVEVSSTHS